MVENDTRTEAYGVYRGGQVHFRWNRERFCGVVQRLTASKALVRFQDRQGQGRAEYVAYRQIEESTSHGGTSAMPKSTTATVLKVEANQLDDVSRARDQSHLSGDVWINGERFNLDVFVADREQYQTFGIAGLPGRYIATVSPHRN